MTILVGIDLLEGFFFAYRYSACDAQAKLFEKCPVLFARLFYSIPINQLTYSSLSQSFSVLMCYDVKFMLLAGSLYRGPHLVVPNCDVKFRGAPSRS
jgi:hypothetical protein